MLGSFSEFWNYITEASNWWGRNGIANRTWAHVQISVIATAVAAAISIPPALVLGHIKRGGVLAVSLANIGRALPSFGIMALAVPFSIRWGFGLGFWPTMVPLVLLGIPPVFTNTYTGVREVDPAIVQSANGMGLQPFQVLGQVELPIALPLIVNGLRIAAVQIVATATLGALIGFSALGSFITEGLSQFNDGKLLTGAFLVAVIAVVTEMAFSALEKVLTPWQRHRARALAPNHGSNNNPNGK